MTQTDSVRDQRQVWFSRVGSVWCVLSGAFHLGGSVPAWPLVALVVASLVGVVALGRLPKRAPTHPLLDPGTNAGVTVAIVAIVVFVVGFIVLHEQLPEVERETWMDITFGAGWLVFAAVCAASSRPDIRA
ncbi:hypothetical protein [Aeromicrobium alkaliterrae]|uniref:Uncharacterized protein n=1 Tax=Aeromicrobium alkaliterrae TaxID=302168 RepID=A0ABN2JLX1_9ACTN